MQKMINLSTKYCTNYEIVVFLFINKQSAIILSKDNSSITKNAYIW